MVRAEANMEQEEMIVSSAALDVSLLPAELVKLELPAALVGRFALPLVQLLAFPPPAGCTRRFVHVMRQHGSLYLVVDAELYHVALAPFFGGLGGDTLLLDRSEMPVPAAARWRCLRVCQGAAAVGGHTLALAGECGIIASVSAPLAEAGVPIDWTSGLYDCDLCLCRDSDVPRLRAVLCGAFSSGNDRLRGQCWLASLAAGGSSAHLASVRRFRT